MPPETKPSQPSPSASATTSIASTASTKTADATDAAIATTTTTMHMDEKSLMAPSYVPEQLRQINRLPVTAVLPTLQPRQTSEFVEKLYNDLVAQVPICYCTTSHAKPPWMNLPIIPVDPYFALSPAASVRASPTFERTFPAIDRVASREEYVNVVSLLLREEFDATLVLYERYSQYGQRITAWGGTKEKDKGTNSTATTATTTTTTTTRTAATGLKLGVKFKPCARALLP
jgi:hypothetical protein